MKISVSSLLEKLIWLLTVFLFTTFLLFETKTWGKYAFLGATVLIVLMSAVIYGGILRIRLQPYHLFIGIFTLFVGVSSVWAMQPSDSFSKMYSVLQIFGCSALLYIHYDRKDNIRSLLSAVKWAGYFVTIYSIAFYGLDALLESAQDLRLTTEFSNVNAIAMAAAISCMLQWGDILKKRNLLSSVMMIPAIILIAATQSRKAFLSLLLGIAGMYLLHSATQKGTAKKILKLLFYMLLLYLGLLLLFQLPVFSGSLERMGSLLNFWSNDGQVDHSTITRNNMIELGINYWKEHPILGIGIGNPHILAARHLNFDSYLHNNFVELLCGGGIVGFVLYYAIYVYLIINLFKYRHADFDAFSISLVWLGLMLIMQYGMVTYYSKTQWYYLVVHFLNVSQLKRKHKEMISNAEEPAPQGD